MSWKPLAVLSSALLVALSLQAAPPAGAPKSPWPSLRGNARNTGMSPHVGPQTNAVKWTFEREGGLSSAVVGAGGTVYVCDERSVYALNASDGSVKWSYKPDGSPSEPGLGRDGTVYVGLGGKVCALSPADGSVVGSYETGAEISGAPVVADDGTIYVRGGGSVRALNAIDGTIKWRYITENPSYTLPSFGADGTVYVGAWNGNVYALDQFNGTAKWVYPAGSTIAGATAVGSDGTIYLTSYNAWILALRPTTGKMKWGYMSGGPAMGSPAVDDEGTAYAGSDDGRVYAINPDQGGVKWALQTGGKVQGSPTVGADGTIYIGSDDKKIYALNAADGSVKWTYQTGAEVNQSPAIGADGTLYVPSRDGTLYAFGETEPGPHTVSGRITESGKGVDGATLTLDPGGLSATTQADGTYAMTGVPTSSYTLTPTKSGYIFAPPLRKIGVGRSISDAFFKARGVDLGPPIWPGFRGDFRNTGRSAYVGARTNAVKWTFKTGSFVSGSAAIGADGPVFVGSSDGNVYALDPADGGVVWSYETGDEVCGSPAISSDGTVYFGNARGKVFAFEPFSGSLRWVSQVGHAQDSRILGSPVIGLDGTIYVGSWDDRFYALNPSDGSVKWSFETDRPVIDSAAIGVDGTVYLATGEEICALDPANGGLKWKYHTDGVTGGPPAVGPDGSVYVGGGGYSNDGRIGEVWCLSSADGKLKWSYSSPASKECVTGFHGSIIKVTDADWPVSMECVPAVGADGSVFFGNGAEEYALDAGGALKWTVKPGGLMSSPPTISADGMVYVGTLGGKVCALSANNGSVKTSFETGKYVTGPPTIGSDGTLYIGSWDGSLYAFGAGGPRHSVSGKVTSSGVGLAGVTMTLAPGGLTATTRADGTFTVADVPNGGYTLSPSKSGYWFKPTSRSVTVLNADASVQDLAAFRAGGSQTAGGRPVWPMLQGNAQRTGLSPYVGAQTSNVKWSFSTDDSMTNSPVIGADGTVYVAAGCVFAVDPADGGLKWKCVLGDGASAAPAIGPDGTIYVGGPGYTEYLGEDAPAISEYGSFFDAARRSHLYAIDPADGSIMWSYEIHGTTRSSPVVGADGAIYFGADNYAMYALDPDGSLKWTHQTSAYVSSPPAIGSDGTVYVCSQDGNLYALDPATGAVKWTKPLGYPQGVSVAGDGTLYVASGDSSGAGKVFALNPSDGSEKWSYTIGRFAMDVSPSVGPDGTVYVVGGDDGIDALSPADGSIKWTHPLSADHCFEGSPVVGADGTIYVGCNNTNIYALSPVDGSVQWSYKTGNWTYTSPAIGADGTVYFPSGDGNVYAFGAGNVRHTVSGRVVVNGAGFEGAVVALVPTRGHEDTNPDGTYTIQGSHWSAFTRSDGSYEITDVPNGTYRIYATKAGFWFQAGESEVVVMNADVAARDFVGYVSPQRNEATAK